MKKTCFGVLIITAITFSCRHTEKLVAEDATYISEYKGPHRLKTSRYRLDSSLSSVSYYTPLGIMDSVFTIQTSGTVVKFEKMQEREHLDSIFLYNEASVLVRSWHFKEKVPCKIVLYFPNGNRDSTVYIQRVDTTEIPNHNSGVISVDCVYSGTVCTYYENGKLRSRGPYERSKPSGVWVYYDLSGEVDRLDTLR